MLPVALFDYDLPDELIARYPAERRDGSRMMVLDRITGAFEIRPFTDLPQFLHAGDAFLCNDAKVRRARMFGRKDGRPDGAKFEILLLSPDTDGNWNVMLKPGKRALPGTEAVLLERDGSLNTRNDRFAVVGKNPDNSYKIRFAPQELDRMEELYGHIPLPPYLNRADEPSDYERYQTVYASHLGAVAAPTAGLHFTPEILAQLDAQGVRRETLTLNVGAGTFLPVSAENAEEHHMHTESFTLPQSAADLVNATHAAGKKVFAVGTTTVRTLESVCDEKGLVHAGSGSTQIFLYPPYKMRSVDMLLTNFHLPKSTLLMLICCFCEREKVLRAYRYAIEQKMRFYSYGDCMLLK